jgi:hypothetical protein
VAMVMATAFRRVAGCSHLAANFSIPRRLVAAEQRLQSMIQPG